MGIMDDAKNALGGLTGAADQAVDAIGGDKIKEGVDAATDKIDSATGGASNVVTEQVDSAAAGEVDKLANN